MYKNTKILPSVNLPIKSVVRTVLDIESYPDFVPRCRAIKILQRDDFQITALTTMLLANGIYYDFTTQTKILHGEQSSVEIISSSNATNWFGFMLSRWEIWPITTSTSAVRHVVEIDINPILLVVVKGAIDRFANDVLKSFINRFELEAKKMEHKGQPSFDGHDDKQKANN